jgi:hypothetical protein
MPRPLPDPAWAAPEFCVCCGYCLTGLTPPGRCPECGAPFVEKQLVLYGVPRSAAGTSVARRVAWVVLIIATGICSQTWILLLRFSWVLAGTIGTAIVGGLIALVLTSRRERGGAERLVVSPLGMVRVPLADPAERERLDSVVVPWAGARSVELKRISPVWYRLRVGTFAPGGALTGVILDAGIRCSDAQAADVRQTIEWYLRLALERVHVEPPPA